MHITGFYDFCKNSPENPWQLHSCNASLRCSKFFMTMTVIAASQHANFYVCKIIVFFNIRDVYWFLLECMISSKWLKFTNFYIHDSNTKDYCKGLMPIQA